MREGSGTACRRRRLSGQSIAELRSAGRVRTPAPARLPENSQSERDFRELSWPIPAYTLKWKGIPIAAAARSTINRFRSGAPKRCVTAWCSRGSRRTSWLGASEERAGRVQRHRRRAATESSRRDCALWRCDRRHDRGHVPTTASGKLQRQALRSGRGNAERSEGRTARDCPSEVFCEPTFQ